MKDILINLILVAILAFFIMQTYSAYKNQQQTLNNIHSSIQSIDSRLSAFETSN